MKTALKKAAPALFRWGGYLSLTVAVWLVFAGYEALVVLLLLLGWFGINFARHLERIRYGLP